MRCYIWPPLTIALLLGLVGACDHRGSGDSVPSGSGGSGLPGSGGMGAIGGSGGTGMGGAAGVGGVAGVGGAVGLDWLDPDEVWRDLPASSEEAQVRVRESAPGSLRFPLLKWSACGPGCEAMSVDGGDREMWGYAMEAVITGDGPRVVLSFNQPRPTYWFRRYVDLRSGATTLALRMDTTRPIRAGQMPPLAGHISDSVYLTSIYANGMMLGTIYDARTSTWEFKFPWAEIDANPCEKWAVDSNPPALFFGCTKVSMLAADDSNLRTTIEESENYGSGSGNAGLSAWSEIFPGTPSTSRIRTWSADEGTRLAVESMPGIACSISVSTNRIVGLRSGDAAQATTCAGRLRAPEFWIASRGGGAVSVWSVPGVEEAFASRTANWGNFAVARVLTGSSELTQAERSQLWLVRLSDGKMRRFGPTPGLEWRGRLVTLDDTHLYLGENRIGEDGSLDRILRYRLDRFDEIGMPLE